MCRRTGDALNRLGSKCVLVTSCVSVLKPGSPNPRGVFAGLSIDTKNPLIACHALGWLTGSRPAAQSPGFSSVKPGH